MMTVEYILACLLIPVMYVLAYIAGKYDFLNTVCLMLQEAELEHEKRIKKLQEEVKRDDAAD